MAIDGLSLCPSLATLLAKDGKSLKFNALAWLCHIIEEERSKSRVFLYILVDKSMVYSYNNLTAQILASKLQNNDFGRAVSLCLLIRNYQCLVVKSQTIFFFNSMVSMHIKPTAPHHTRVLTASVKKIQLLVVSHKLFLLHYRKTWPKMEPWPKVDVLPYIC